MKIFNRLLTLITPACGHEAEIHDLRNRLQVSTNARELAERQAGKSSRESLELRNRLEQVAAHRDLLNHQVTELTAEVDRRLATIEDLAQQLDRAMAERDRAASDAKTIFGVANTTYSECLSPIAEAFGWTATELDDSFVQWMLEQAELLRAAIAHRDVLNRRLTELSTVAEERRVAIEELARLLDQAELKIQIRDGYLADKASLEEALETAIAARDAFKLEAEKSEAVLAMTVQRLGGLVDGAPTARHNFLQRVDELVTSVARLNENLLTARERIETLEAALGEDGLDEQLSLMHSPFVEAGGEAPILQDRLISDSTSEQSYRLVGIFFEGRSHWVLARGEERIKAPIQDHAFLERMRRSEVSFTSGDTLRAMVRVQGWRKPNNDSYAVYSVEEVLEIIHPDEQLELPAPAGEEAQHA